MRDCDFIEVSSAANDARVRIRLVIDWATGGFTDAGIFHIDVRVFAFLAFPAPKR